MAKYYWRAVVVVTGIPTLTDEDYAAMRTVAPLLARHDVDGGNLYLSWRFSIDGATVSEAIERASYTWRAALGQAPGTNMVSPEVECMEFRVYRVNSL